MVPSARIARGFGLVALALLVLLPPVGVQAQWLNNPQPGEVFKEFTKVISTGNDDFRVTDPNTTRPEARAFL
ncbi:MAG: hypothetical protein WB626_02595, partial [Bacteroidota bacterium]